MPLQEFSGAAVQVRLSGTLSAGELGTFSVDQSVNGFPTGATAPFVVTIDRGTASEEKILVTTRSGAAFNGLTRGYDGTNAVQHSDQAIVEHTIDAVSLTEMNRHVNDDTRDDHSQYLEVDGGRALTNQGVLIGTPVASAPGDVNTKGVALTVAASDHKHGREAAAVALKVGHTFAIAGDVVVASGSSDYVVPFFVPVAAGRTVKIVGHKRVIQSGTSADVTIRKNGVAITGLTNLTVSTTAASANLSPGESLADGDLISLVVNSVVGSPKNMTFTLYLEHA